MRRVLQRVTILLQRATERMIITTHKKTLLEAAITLSGDGEATKTVRRVVTEKNISQITINC